MFGSHQQLTRTSTTNEKFYNRNLWNNLPSAVLSSDTTTPTDSLRLLSKLPPVLHVQARYTRTSVTDSLPNLSSSMPSSSLFFGEMGYDHGHLTAKWSFWNKTPLASGYHLFQEHALADRSKNFQKQPYRQLLPLGLVSWSWTQNFIIIRHKSRDAQKYEILAPNRKNVSWGSNGHVRWIN